MSKTIFWFFMSSLCHLIRVRTWKKPYKEILHVTSADNLCQKCQMCKSHMSLYEAWNDKSCTCNECLGLICLGSVVCTLVHVLEKEAYKKTFYVTSAGNSYHGCQMLKSHTNLYKGGNDFVNNLQVEGLAHVTHYVTHLGKCTKQSPILCSSK